MRCCTIRTYDLQRLLSSRETVEQRISDFLDKAVLFRQNVDREEIKGHIAKAENNLRFVADIAQKNYFDWALTGCYYACYHAALALMQTRGYTSKNHLATLCVIIKEFYRKELTEEDVELLAGLLDYEDILFYVEAKNRREDATYSTKTVFEKQEVERLRIQAALFVNKIKDIIQDE